MVEVSQDFYDLLVGQQASFVDLAGQYETGRDTAEANRALYQDYADASQLVLDQLEVIAE